MPRSRGFVLLLCSLLGSAGSAGAAPVMSDAEMTDYLTQSLCLDAAGTPNATLPIDPACTMRRPQTSQDTAVYRKHDWPDATDQRHPVKGYQASDSVLLAGAPRAAIEQTFDFGDTPRSFGHFDAGLGDGGQVLLLVGGRVSIVMTEDGGDGVQWFIGGGCSWFSQNEQRLLSWQVMAPDIVPDQWHHVVARLNKTRSPDACPMLFNTAYTRYRQAQLEFPFRIVASDGAVTTETHRLDLVISEHYGGDAMSVADHLERFYFARGLGMVRWERWENPALSHDPRLDDDAAAMARSERCAQLGMNETADQHWAMVDCRTWTTLVRQDKPWTVADFDWPALSMVSTLGGK